MKNQTLSRQITAQFSISQSFSLQSPFSRSKTDRSNKIVWEIQNLNLRHVAQQEMTAQCSNQCQMCNKALMSQGQIEESINNSINSLFDSESQYENQSDSNKNIVLNNEPSEPIEFYQYVPVNPQKNSSLSSISCIAYKYSSPSSTQSLYNLFSNFGNINMIVRKKQMIYVSFRNQQSAEIAIKYLNGCVFQDNQMNLSLVASYKQAYPKENQFSQCAFYDSSSDRFTSESIENVIPPSKYLIVSYLSPYLIDQSQLYQVMQNYGSIIGIQIYEGNCAKVQFQNLQSSLRAIGQLHLSFLGEYRLHISFACLKM